MYTSRALRETAFLVGRWCYPNDSLSGGDYVWANWRPGVHRTSYGCSCHKQVGGRCLWERRDLWSSHSSERLPISGCEGWIYPPNPGNWRHETKAWWSSSLCSNAGQHDGGGCRDTNQGDWLQWLSSSGFERLGETYWICAETRADSCNKWVEYQCTYKFDLDRAGCYQCNSPWRMDK